MAEWQDAGRQNTRRKTVVGRKFVDGCPWMDGGLTDVPRWTKISDVMSEVTAP
jgi:hypothetical protein